MPDASVDYLHLDVYLRGDPTVRYDTLPRYLELSCTDELKGPGGGTFKIHVDDPKLAGNLATLFKHKNVFKIRRNDKSIGAFLLQTRDLVEVDSNEVGSRTWTVSGEGLRGWFRDAVVFPENGNMKKYTPANRAFNFSCINKSRWYNNSTWTAPTKISKVRSPGSPYSTKPANWPDVPNAYWVWGTGTGVALTAKQQAAIDTTVTPEKAVVTTLAKTNKDVGATKPSTTTVHADFTLLRNQMATLKSNIADVLAVVTGTVDAVWRKVSSAITTADGKCATARGSTKSTDWKAAISAVNTVVTDYIDASATRLPGPVMAKGDCYFRCEFTAPAAGQYTFYLAANNTIDAYIDGQLVLSMPSSAETYDNVQQVQQDLDAGAHVFAVKVTNTSKSIAGLIAAIFQEGTPATGDNAAIPAKLINYTGSTGGWQVCSYPDVAPGWTPGEIMLQLLKEAQNRGVLFPGWIKPTFTEDVDTAGVPWTRSDDFSFNVGTEYFDVLSALETAGGDAWINPNNYNFNLYGSRGVNRSGLDLTTLAQDTSQLNPIVLRIGTNLLQAENTVTGQIKNDLLIQTADGWTLAKSAPDSELGVIEGSYQSDQKSSASGTIGKLALQKFSTPDTSSTYGIVPLSNITPGDDFNTGDYVQAPGDDFLTTARRVLSFSASADQATGIATYTVEFDTIVHDRLLLLERRVDKLMSTGTSVGSSLTSTTSVNLPGGVSPGVPGVPVPTLNAPTNLHGESNTYYTTDGTPEASVALDWDDVLSSADGAVAQNVAYYEVWGSQTGDAPGSFAKTMNTTFLVMGLDIDVSYTFMVRARQSDGGGYSNFSNAFEIRTAVPTDELDQPTPPIVTSKLGVFTVSWDGNLVADDASTHEADPRLSQVRLFLGSKPDLTDGAYVGQPLSAKGSTVLPDLIVGNTYYFRFVAVDSFGLVSAPSDIVSAALQGIVLGDMEPGIGSILSNGATILYQPTAPGVEYQNPTTTWYDTAHGYRPYRWNTAGDNAWDPVTWGLQDDGSGTAVYSFIQTGAIAANAISALQIQTRAITSDKIDVGAIHAEHIQLGNYIPSGYGTQRVPGPLLDGANWTKAWNGITARNLQPENVTYTDQGVLLSSTSTARALWSATPVLNVPASGKIIVDWISNNDATQLWIRFVTAANQFGWWQAFDLDGTQQKSAFGHFVMDFNKYSEFTGGRADGPVLQYAVYMVLDPGVGTSLIKSMSVNEIDPALTNMESVQITQAGVFMYNQDGTTSMSLAVGAKNFLAYNNEDGGAVTLDRLGNGAFSTSVSAAAVYGTDVVGVDDGTYMDDTGITINGIDLLGSIDNVGTYFGYQQADGNPSPYLDRFSRNVVYRGYWDMPDGANHYLIRGQYQRFASGYFVLQPGRQYMILVNNGSLQIGTTEAAKLANNLYMDLMLEVGGLSQVILSGVRAMRAVVYADTDAQGNYVHPPITVAAVAGAALTAQNLTVGVIPAGVPIFWQYGSSLSAVPPSTFNLTSWGSGQSLTVIDQGPAFTNYFDPAYAADNAMTGPASGQTATSGGGSTGSSGGGSAGQTTKTVTASKTYSASWSRSWNQSGGGIVSGSGTYTDAHMMYTGLGVSPMGSMAGFPALNLPSGAKVTKVQLYLKNRHFYYNAGGTVHIGYHGQGSTPGSFTTNDRQSYGWNYGQGKWVTLPSSWNSGFGSGSYRGISLGIDGSNATYAYFDGDGKTAQPMLKVTYTYKTS